jgi:hypothetical protein
MFSDHAHDAIEPRVQTLYILLREEAAGPSLGTTTSGEAVICSMAPPETVEGAKDVPQYSMNSW